MRLHPQRLGPRALPVFIAVSALAIALCGCGGDSSDPTKTPPPPKSSSDAGAAPVAAKKAVGQLEAPVGTVTLERGSGKRPAKAEPLFVGDVIDTGAESSANLRFGGDRVVELGPDGRFEVGEDGAGVSLNVIDGLVLTRVKATPAQGKAPGGDADGGQFEGQVLVTIATPFGLTRVGAAELSLKVKDGAADVDVKIGEIELIGKDGAVQKIGAGKKGFLGTVKELPEIPLTIVVTSGKAELKAKDTRSFVPINPRKLPALKAGDMVRVKDGRFALAPEGSSTRVVLLKGTEVGIVEARKGAGGDATALDVQKGELEVAAPGGQSTRVGVAPGLTLVSDLGGQFTLRRTGSGFDIDALAGDVTIEREGEAPQTIPGGQSAAVPLKGGKPAVRAANKEAIVLPPRNVRLFHTGLKKVSLAWDDDDGKTSAWRFQLATDSTFKDTVRDGVVHDAFVSVPVNAKGWYWRVFNGPNEVAKGSVNFANEPKTADLSRVKNEVAGKETSVHFQDKDKPPQLTFVWEKEEGAAKYAVKIYREGQLGAPLVERTVTETQLTENTLPEGDYRWSLTPIDSKGAEMRGGALFKLHVVFDNGVASLVIKTPRNGDPGGKTVKTSGVVPVGAKLYINGKAVELDEHARFDTSVAPLGGGRLVYRLVSGGAESWTVRTVRGK
ncbi:MAG: hypothetical protein JNM17_27685 [Archangium sp.]|nr:hypothetical protein [Archangium sp.]